MKKLTLSISRYATFQAVAMKTAYHGVRTADAETLYDKVATVNADDALLDVFWRDCCASADSLFGEYGFGLACRNYDADYHVLLQMTDNWPSMQKSMIEVALQGFFVETMVARWMSIVMPEAENRYSALADKQMALVRNGLEARIRKPRPQCQPIHKKTIENEDKNDNSNHSVVETADSL